MSAVLEVEHFQIQAGRTQLHVPFLALHAGQSMAVTGPTGCGKSLFVRALCGLHPSVGMLKVCGVEPSQAGWPAVHARMGVLMALPGLLDHLNVVDNVAYKLRRDGLEEAAIQQRVAQVLDQFSLSESAQKLPAQLSGGMRRRAALARALIHRPQLLLLDDPTAGLDPITTAAVMDFILDAAGKQGACVLLTTHDLHGVAARTSQVMAFEGDSLKPSNRRVTAAPWAAA